MPRFMRSIWSRPAANAPGGDSAIPDELPAMNEELERLKEAEFVRDFQSKLMDFEEPTANADAAPGVTNIFAPAEGKRES